MAYPGADDAGSVASPGLLIAAAIGVISLLWLYRRTVKPGSVVCSGVCPVSELNESEVQRDFSRTLALQANKIRDSELPDRDPDILLVPRELYR